jgi:rhodanese-related sulfurtransferase
MFEDLSLDDYKAKFHDASVEHLLLDVRTEEEFAQIRIPGAVNIPLEDLSAEADEVAENADGKPIVMVCRTGVRSMLGAQILRMSGITEPVIYNLNGGTKGWYEHQWPVEMDE